ncbi:DUF6201 family protein [Aeromonas cavernicola]|uniref:Uncharacterized protein n=1 Tax=Aeromonas cavernicola TaxID=1006623 RepID=A0A2H9U7E9_9GAMM|nr:DUF6201 family protein [Aeromonas cavernicola]PJG59918.1 hypothetical protein CUC53_04640 [Aeromonas cavernicola]
MKKLAKIVFVLFAVYWLLLAHVSLNFLDVSPPISRLSEDGKYKVILNDMHPVNPIGLYCLLTTDWAPKYFVLLDADDNYIGQSSPFACYWPWGSAVLIFPGEAVTLDKNSFLVLDDEYDGEFNISIESKRWWSWLFSIFY